MTASPTGTGSCAPPRRRSPACRRINHRRVRVSEPPRESLGLTLTVRSKGCTLAGGQLAVSGVPTVAEDVNSTDSDCGSPKRHKVVDPDEISEVAVRVPRHS